MVLGSQIVPFAPGPKKNSLLADEAAPHNDSTLLNILFHLVLKEKEVGMFNFEMWYNQCMVKYQMPSRQQTRRFFSNECPLWNNL